MIDHEASFGPFHLIPSRRLLLCDGKPVPLGGPACNVLLALIEGAREVVPKDTLIARAWGAIHVDGCSLRTVVAALRHALRAMESSHTYMAADVGRGYRFAAPVVFGKPSVNRCELPMQFSRVIGRDKIVADLLEDIGRHRLITVVGPGGIKKSTAAFYAARLALSEHRVDSTAYVDLAAAEDRNLLPSIAGAAFGIVAEPRALFERGAAAPRSELTVRNDGMVQTGPDPIFAENAPERGNISSPFPQTLARQTHDANTGTSARPLGKHAI
jgi:DNA-binding winged helix-turn-helix (wHTH) protein